MLISLVGVRMLFGAEQPTADGTGSIERTVSRFVAAHCYGCHNSALESGGHNFDALPWSLRENTARERWTRVYDRIAAREMPPGPDSVPQEERRGLLDALSGAIHSADVADAAAQGRNSLRRLNRSEFEWNLRDLLQMPHLDIKSHLPEDRIAHGFNKSADGLDMSYVQLAAYLDATKTALLQAVASDVAPPEPKHYYASATRMFPVAETFGGPEAIFYARDSKMIPISQGALEELRKSENHDESLEMALFRSASWPYYGYPDGFVAETAGEYRVRFEARAVVQVRDFRLRPATEPLPMTFRARKPSGPDVSGDVRAVGGLIDIQPESAIYKTSIRLMAGETFEYSLLGLPVPIANVRNISPTYYDFPPMPAGGHRGVAFRWIEVSGPVAPATWPPASHSALFGDLPIRRRASMSGSDQLSVAIVSNDPRADARRLLRRFARNAAHRPVPDSALQVYENLVFAKLDQGEAFGEALLSGYQAFLCSVHFLYLREPDDKEPHYDIASRLSHFLWNSRPDHELQAAAANGELFSPLALERHAARMIEHPKFLRFIDNFLDYWLDLKEINRDDPDIGLYPEYRLDDYLIESMMRETKASFIDLVRANLPVRHIVDSDFVHVNDRLAQHYGLPPVSGSAIRKVSLAPGSPYGGFLTQAAVAKVTANGTTTSPVVRGAWVMDRLIGDPPPPPPADVPAVEPDTRGATTIREILALHARAPQCASCHARFDPVGMALENFDVMGAWRDRYRGLDAGILVTGIDRAGHDFEYRVAKAVDASGTLLDGEKFRDIRELKTLLARNPRHLARNLLERFAIYATGVPIRFSDRREIDQILDRCAQDGYRVRDLLLEVVKSKMFLGRAKLKESNQDG